MGVAVSKLTLSDACKNTHLEFDGGKPILHADCWTIKDEFRDSIHDASKVNINDMTTEKHSTFPLDLVFGNLDGALVWGFKDSALQNKSGQYVPASIDINKLFYNNIGVLQAQSVPMVLAVPKDSSQVVLDQLEDLLRKDPDAKLAAIDRPNDTTTFVMKKAGVLNVEGHGKKEGDATTGYAEAHLNSDLDGVFTSVEAGARASVFHVASKTGRPIESFRADIVTASASASWAGVSGGPGHEGVTTYIGADARLNLVDLQASVFDLNIGAGVETGAGIKDGSVDLHALGCGFTVGRKVSISAFGSSFGIDFGRFF